jgi:hypothetical protein
MIKILTELVDKWEKVSPTMEKMLATHKSMVGFDHCITAVGQRFLITIIIQLPKK